MNSLRNILAHLRVHHRCEMRHKKALRHAHHALHTSYLSAYVWEWHMPVSLLCLGLLILAIASWVAPWLEIEP